MIWFRTKDHPCAGGKSPAPGIQQWNLDLDLENGERLRIHMGQETRDAIRNMMLAEMLEEAVVRADES